MTNGSSSLPPAALAKLQAKAFTQNIAVRIISLPESMKGNTTQTKISGTVVGQNNDGALEIQTPKGMISLSLRDRGSLPQGTRIEIDLPAGRTPQQATIRPDPAQLQTQTQPHLADTIETLQLPARPAVESRPPLNTTTLETILTSGQTSLDADTPPIPLPVGPLQVGQILRLLPTPAGIFTLIPPAPVSSNLTVQVTFLNALMTLIENLPAGQTIQKTSLLSVLARLDLNPLRQSGIQQEVISPLLQKIDAILGTKPQTSSPLPSPTGQPTGTPTLSPASLTIFTPNKPIDVKIFGLQSPLSPTSISTQTALLNLPLSSTETVLSIPASSPQTTPLTLGQVAGFTKDGRTILSLQTGPEKTQLFTLPFQTNNLSVGTSILLELSATPTAPVPIDQEITLPILPLRPSDISTWLQQNNGLRTWDSLDNLLQTLTQISPQQAQAFANLIPTPTQPHSMGILGLFFLSALRSGEAINWLVGETAAALLRQTAQGRDLLRAAGHDLSISTRIDATPLPQDWKMAMMPMLWDQQIYKLPLYYKHMPDENDADRLRKNRRLRFLFDLTLTRMGDVQVDGFMQSERLDIILRTKTPLSPPMQSKMKQIYAGAMEKSRLNGDLSFQFKPENWVDLLSQTENCGINA